MARPACKFCDREQIGFVISTQGIKGEDVPFPPLPDARTVIDTLPIWFEHDNTVHPHKALGYLSPREFIASRQSR